MGKPAQLRMPRRAGSMHNCTQKAHAMGVPVRILDMNRTGSQPLSVRMEKRLKCQKRQAEAAVAAAKPKNVKAESFKRPRLSGLKG